MFRFLYVLCLLMVSDFALADDVPAMFANGTESYIKLFQLSQYVGVIIGIYLCISAVLKMIQLGQSPNVSPKTPILMFFVGVGLIASTSFINIIHMEMFQKPPSTVLINAGGSNPCGAVVGAAMDGVYMFLKLVGIIAFIRGWLLLNQSALGKEGLIGKALTHIIGGVALMNVIFTANLLKVTFFKSLPSQCFGF